MYSLIFRNSLNASLNYRTQLFVNSVIGFIPSLGVIFIWLYVSDTYSIPGYSKSDIITYVLLAKLLQQSLVPDFQWSVIEEVKSGDLAKYLVKPLSHFKYWLSKEAAVILLKLAIAALSAVIIYVVFSKYLVIPNWSSLLMFSIVAVLAFVLYFQIYYLISMLSFWLVEVFAIIFTADILIEFFAGVLIPLDLFPTWLAKIIGFLPFYYMIFLPIQCLINKIDLYAFGSGIMIQIIWIAILSVVINLTWKAGVKRYDGAGL